jgi:alcohol dehydrogenase class IV
MLKFLKCATPALAVAALFGAMPAIVQAQTQAPGATATVEAYYSTDKTLIGDLMANPATRAVLVKHIPVIVENSQFPSAYGMTLKAIQPYAPDVLTDEKLAAIDADLKTIPAPAK